MTREVYYLKGDDYMERNYNDYLRYIYIYNNKIISYFDLIYDIQKIPASENMTTRDQKWLHGQTLIHNKTFYWKTIILRMTGIQLSSIRRGLHKLPIKHKISLWRIINL